MTEPSDSQPAVPAKKPLDTHTLITLALVGMILLIALIILFSAPVINGFAGSDSGRTAIPGTTEIPTAEIATKSVTCQVTGTLGITGTVKSNVNHSLYVEIYGAGYDSTSVELGTGYDSVEIEPYGSNAYTIHVIDGCQLGDSGTYDVRIAAIRWR